MSVNLHELDWSGADWSGLERDQEGREALERQARGNPGRCNKDQFLPLM